MPHDGLVCGQAATAGNARTTHRILSILPRTPKTSLFTFAVHVSRHDEQDIVIKGMAQAS